MYDFTRIDDLEADAQNHSWLCGLNPAPSQPGQSASARSACSCARGHHDLRNELAIPNTMDPADSDRAFNQVRPLSDPQMFCLAPLIPRRIIPMSS